GGGRRDVARVPRPRRVRVPPPRASGAEGAVMADATLTTDVAIQVRDLGIRFRRNRRGRRNFKDLFADSSRRSRPGEFWALRDVTFDVRAGEAIGVVGRNGQGKSTLLKLVAGVLLPDEGSVRVHGGVAPL